MMSRAELQGIIQQYNFRPFQFLSVFRITGALQNLSVSQEKKEIVEKKKMFECKEIESKPLNMQFHVGCIRGPLLAEEEELKPRFRTNLRPS